MAEHRTPKVVGRGPHPMPQPCVVCKKPFSVLGYWSVVKKRITCGGDCARQVFCRDLLKCKICLQRLPRDQFEMSYYSGRPLESCLKCRANRRCMQPKPPHTCIKCGMVKPDDHFGRYKNDPNGSLGQRRAYCLDCAGSERVKGQGPHKVPHPCSVCGREFEAKGYWSHVKHLKTCSRQCFLLPRQTDGRSCSRCKKHMAREEFDTKPNTTELKHCCRGCSKERDRDRRLLLRMRPSAFQMWRTAELRAKREGCAFELTQIQARTLFKGNCCLCGRAPSSIRRAATGPITKHNNRLYCRRCCRLLNIYEHTELFLLAHEIAARNPLLPKESRHAK